MALHPLPPLSVLQRIPRANAVPPAPLRGNGASYYMSLHRAVEPPPTAKVGVVGTWREVCPALGVRGHGKLKAERQVKRNIQLKPCLRRWPIFLKKGGRARGGEVFFLRLTKPSQIEATSVKSVKKRCLSIYYFTTLKTACLTQELLVLKVDPFLWNARRTLRVHRCKLAGNERDRVPHDLQNKHDVDQARIGSKASNTDTQTQSPALWRLSGQLPTRVGGPRRRGQDCR